MSKISSYANDSTPDLGDKVIGTDVNNMDATKNFTLGQILNLGVSEGITASPDDIVALQAEIDALQAEIDALALYYGSFYDTTTQTATAVNTAYPVKLNSTDSTATNGFSIITDGSGNKTILKAVYAGVYNIAFSAQLRRGTGGTSETVDFWLKKNGSNVSYTNTSVSVQANAGLLVAAWNFFIQMDAGAEVQLMWATTSTAIELNYAGASSPHPETPSVILTVNKVS